MQHHEICHPRATGTGLGRAWLIAAACAALASALGASEAQREDEGRVQGFSIPNTRSALVLMRSATDHIEAERWNEAILDLQELIQTHHAELVPLEQGGNSGRSVHGGAGGWATEQLLRMPPQARELYNRRFEERAQAALEVARGLSDRQGICRVAERWPATGAALSAWWSLGDLELEYGNLAASRQAWSRALCALLTRRDEPYRTSFDAERSANWAHMLELLGDPAAQLAGPARELVGELERTQFALASLTAENPLHAACDGGNALRGSLRLPGPGEAAHGAPGPGASSWPVPFRLPSGGPFERGWHNLFPVRVGDLVFLSDSLQLFAIHAYSGQLEWSSKLSSEWSNLGRERAEFFKGISREDTMIAPAATREIVVSAHQVPVSDIENEEFRRIAITTVIPDRRLYAYDTRSGKELWNHHPPAHWDGESGGFLDRMSVAGPPVITASRVFVPMYRMYGRIEFYVACCDLLTGELLWSTQLVSGQRELNMFARSEREFSAPPVRVEGDRVVVLTQLGAVAAIDLFSGSILWETLYDQIPPPPRAHFGAQRLKNLWRNAAPVVADGVVVATPFDCRDLLGLDLESGRTLWTVRHERIERIAGGGRGQINVLVGADERTVFLGSWPVLALRSPSGLSREAPTSLAWRYPGGDILSSESTTARALLLDDSLIIPTRAERIDVDRFGGGRRHKSLPWKGGRNGNLLVGGGTLYSLTPQSLDGYFEWDMLLARGRRNHEDNGHDLDSSVYLCSLLVERSRTERSAGHTAAARDWLVEAEEILAPFLAEKLPSSELHEQMHALLRMRGKVFIDLADGNAASLALRRAREYVRTPLELRDTLIEEYLLVREFDGAAREELLRVFEARCAVGSLTALVDDDERHPYGWRFDPLVEESSGRVAPWRIPISLWVALERTSLAASEERAADEFEGLHALLAKWPDQALPTAAGDREQPLPRFVKRRIGQLLEREGRAAYAPFDDAARLLLEQARTTRDREALGRVSKLYPFSIAGREANDELLQWSIEEGDVEAVAQIVLSELPLFFAPEWANDRERQLLLFLAAVLEAAGNRDYAGEVLRTLARDTPELVSLAPTHAGASLSELARQHPKPAAAPEHARPRVGSLLNLKLTVPGSHRLLGEIPPALPRPASTPAKAGRVLLYAKKSAGRLGRNSLVAYSDASLDGPQPAALWELQLSRLQTPNTWRNTLAFVPGAVLASSPESVYALRRSDGQRLWSEDWFANDGDVDSVRVESGLVIVSVRTRGEQDVLHSLDLASGREIWSAPINRAAYDRTPLVGENRVVLMPRHAQRRGLVLDAFSGRVVLEFELPSGIHQTAHAASWIEEGLLIVPWFLTGRNPERNRMLAIDLWTGAVAWNVNFDEVLGGGRQLRSIMKHAHKSYLLLTPKSGARRQGVRGILAELHVGIGATRRVGNFELASDQLRLIGVPQERRVTLESPTLFIRSFSEETQAMRVLALELPLGNTRWVAELELSRDQLHNSLLHMPVESEQTLGLIFSSKEARGFGAPHSTLYMLDAQSGSGLSSMRLGPELGTSNQITLSGLGRNLVLGGKSQLEVWR